MSVHLPPDAEGRAPRLSVIVPIYNVERYLDACLASIADQSFVDCEVLMIDDGSPDGSAEIARGWAARDHRFRLIQQTNHGLGHARNTGARHAAGEYLAFMDSDDLVPAHAYAMMIESLDASGSDFALGNVHRFDSTRRWQTSVYQGVADRRQVGTHITRNHDLLRDHLAPNKVWRTSFWRDAELVFPVGVFYEDVPTIIPAHFRARAVDIVPEVVLLWRKRDSGDLSITQGRATDPRQVRDRVAAVTSNGRFFADQGATELKTAYDALALNRDLRLFMDVFDGVSDPHREEMRQAIESFLLEVSPESLGRVTAVNRIKYALLHRRLFTELAGLAEFCRSGEIKNVPVVIEGERAVLDLDLRRDPALDLPADVFDVTAELALVCRLSDIRVDQRGIELDGWAYLDRVSTGPFKASRIEVWWEAGDTRIPARVVRRSDHRASGPEHESQTDRSESAFTATVPFQRLRAESGWQARNWAVMVAVTHGPVRRVTRIDRPLPGRPERPVVHRLEGDWWLRLCWETDGLAARVRQEHAVVSDTTAGDGALTVTLTLGARCGADPVLELRPVGSGQTHVYAVERDAGRRDVGQVRIGAATLSAGASGGSTEELAWGAYVRPSPTGRAQHVLVDEGCGGAAVADDASEYATRRTRLATLNVLHQVMTPKLHRAQWTGGATLAIEMEYPGRAAEAIVLTAGSGTTLTFPVTQVGGRVSAAMDLEAVAASDPSTATGSRRWDVHLRTDTGEQELLVWGDVTWLPLSVTHAGQVYALTDRKWHRVSVLVSADHTGGDRDGAGTGRLRTAAARMATSILGRRPA